MLPRLPSTDYQSKTENRVVRRGAWMGRNAYMATGRIAFGAADLAVRPGRLRALVGWANL